MNDSLEIIYLLQNPIPSFIKINIKNKIQILIIKKLNNIYKNKITIYIL